MGVSICLNFLVKACQNGREKVPPVCASFRPEEDVDGGGALQARQRPYQSQRPPAPPRRTPHPPPKAGGAAVAFGQGSVLGRRHQSPRQWRWSHRSSLRDSSSHFQVFGRLLPEVRRRGFEEGDQGHPHLLRSIAPRSRPQEERAQEVRRSRRQSQIPEILPLEKDENCDADVELRVVVVVVVSGRRAAAMAGSQTRKTADWTDLYTHLFFLCPLQIYILVLTFDLGLSIKMLKLSFTVLLGEI